MNYDLDQMFMSKYIGKCVDFFSIDDGLGLLRRHQARPATVEKGYTIMGIEKNPLGTEENFFRASNGEKQVLIHPRQIATITSTCPTNKNGGGKTRKNRQRTRKH